ncbi:molybdopterin biosynthesis protein [Romboutsia lituseburensis]|uniref:Molybdopterin molybdenumtransferase n=1 Tax=Romboutsia lituseburensis DSM 797 TaxID=1121325 RepID=A0A1G9KM61_9FIRM|nr:molybdopterin biosynthesis protein [Romboutsia lituseburensis]CEH34963.1 Molybdopterin molybdenumtransferase [Romboutsia lituseburensis]SDL50696.1 molybdopterin molybdochelatase [Romboutsia lituseburensis DSM 797]
MGKYLMNIPLEDGLDQYLNEIKDLKKLEGEFIDVNDCLNKVTCEPVYSNLSSPFYNCSAMDGIAVKAKSTFMANEQNIITLKENIDYIEVDTGDPIPKDFDAVIMIEDVLSKENKTAKIYKPAIPWQHIRCIGEDIVEQEMIIPSFHKIRPQDIGAMISARVQNVKVFKGFKVGIIPTGTELITKEETPKVGDIIESNSKLFEGLIVGYGAIPVIYPIVKDNYNQIKKSVLNALDECDMVLISAGSSQGREDYTHDIIAEIGKVLIHGLAIKPGKPAILGYARNKPIIGIPGYPVSAWVVMENIVRPTINKLTYKKCSNNKYIAAKLGKRIMSSLKYEEFIRVKLGKVNGEYIAMPIKQGAGTITSLVNADGVIRVSQNIEGIAQGSSVKVELLKDIDEINKTILAIGSHDLIVDLISSELTKNSLGQFKLNSIYVGSEQGILALKNDECNISPAHLFKLEDEDYSKYFIDEDISIIKLAKRTQGIIVKKGNPLKIESLDELVKYRIVNRQKGSASRILLDNFIDSKNIKKSSINGYKREESTNMSVAKTIQNDDADCAIGIYSVSKAFGLDFIPICEHEYGILVKTKNLQDDSIKKMLDVINSNPFKQKINSLGGYDLSQCGEVLKYEKSYN